MAKYPMPDTMETQKRCKLDSGKIVYYDGCCDVGVKSYNDKFTYVGEGITWDIDGIRQVSNEKRDFYVQKEIGA